MGPLRAGVYECAHFNSQRLPLLAGERRMPWTQLFNSSPKLNGLVLRPCLILPPSFREIHFVFFFLCNPADRQMSPLAVATKQKQRQPFPYKRTKLHIMCRRRLGHRLSQTATTSMNSRQHAEGQRQPSRNHHVTHLWAGVSSWTELDLEKGETLHSSARRPFHMATIHRRANQKCLSSELRHNGDPHHTVAIATSHPLCSGKVTKARVSVRLLTEIIHDFLVV